MVPTCSECQHLVQVYVTADDPPLHWCNNPDTKEFVPPIGCVRPDAACCDLFVRLESIQSTSSTTPAAPQEGTKLAEKRTLEARLVVGFCLLMMILALIPALMHDGERAVIAVSHFVQTCERAIDSWSLPVTSAQSGSTSVRGENHSETASANSVIKRAK